jgi:hypothetical protein
MTTYTEPSLWDFDGTTYEPERDKTRLSRQLIAVRSFMSDYEWHTLEEIAAATGEPEASISARLRDLRKPRFGAYIVDREYVSAGLWHYRLAVKGER